MYRRESIRIFDTLMWKTLAISLTLLFASTSFGQGNLYETWKDESQKDSVRADAYLNYLVQNYYSTKKDSCQILLDELRGFCRANDLPKIEALSLKIKGIIYYQTDEIKLALDNLNIALKINENLHDEVGIASVLNNIGLVYQFQGDYEKALTNYSRSQELFMKNDEFGQLPIRLPTLPYSI